jgi:NAD(P)H-dependent FMN reductase
MIFISPEYNGSTPPVFTNSLAWVSRTGKEWRGIFNRKTAVIATHSGSGGAHVLMSMRLQLSYLGMNVLGRQILTHYTKELNQETLMDILDQLILSLRQ